METIGELRLLMDDSARLDAYFASKETSGTVEWPLVSSTAAPPAPVATKDAASLALDDLPTKLSALSDMLEAAGATDDDVAEVWAAALLR